MKILTELCSIPTAPFVEHHVVEFIERFARQRRKLRLSRDEHGNLLLELAGTKKGLPRWVFTAHMDHPGLVARGMIDDRTVEADFRGGVLGEYVEGTTVVFFDEGREVRAKVTEVESEAGEYKRAKLVRARVKERVRQGAAGMFDLVPARVKGGKFHSRACDDLAGAAGALAMLDQLQRKPSAAPVAVLLTRAEEDGFVGAIAASIKPKLLRQSDRIIAIECSAMQSYAPQGKGPIIRLGDKTSIFNSSLSYFMTQQAEALKKQSRGFEYQRTVMPGGTCEATVYDVYGFQAGSICVALGNYHNMDRERKRLAAEYIDVNDWKGMVKLFVAIARHGHEYRQGHAALKERLAARFEKHRHLL